MSAPWAFVSALLMVALKATQTLNVVHGRRVAAVATSYLIALAEAGVVLAIVRGSAWSVIAAIGTGGAAGSLLAIEVQRRLARRREGS